MDSAKGRSRDEALSSLADRIDSFEKYAGPHARVIADLAARLARRLGLGRADVSAIAEAALLHDIGMYALSPAYAAVPGPLNFEERLDLWRHAIVGEQQMAKRDAPRHAQLLVRWHHEWWNGSGYPDMLAFEDIPIGARILRALDLLSSLTADRPYRPALAWDEAVEALKSAAGIECDPYVALALLALLDEMRQRLPRPEPEPAEAPPPAKFDTNPDLAALTDPLPAPSVETWDLDAPAAPSPYEAFQQPAQPSPESPAPEPEAAAPPALRPVESPPAPPPVTLELLLRHADPPDGPDANSQWRGWQGTSYNRKTLLGFEASVLGQLEFRSVAIALSGWSRLGWYLKAWGKAVFANDPRAWAATAARAALESPMPLGEEHVARLLEDVYVPGYSLANPDLRRWFGETDAWWLDNLRRNALGLDDESLQAQALTLGMQAGDYALSFTDETRSLKRPLTTVFRRLAERFPFISPGQTPSRGYHLPVDQFVQQARADLLYLDLPAAHTEQAGGEARAAWRESWVRGAGQSEPDDLWKFATLPQSKQAYLLTLDRLLRGARHVRTWAIGYQEVGLVSARDVSELIKEHRPVRATYSKDLTEVVGGLRNYIIVADRA